MMSKKSSEFSKIKKTTNTAPEASSRKNKELHFRNIKQLKESERKEETECIVQIRPNLGDGEYRRRRGYTKHHKNSWIASLEKSKYVKCLFQNCHFIAMSLEDMICHFGYCNGDSSFAEYTCPVCHGCVTSKEILRKHLDRSHGGLNLQTHNIVTEQPMSVDIAETQTNNHQNSFQEEIPSQLTMNKPTLSTEPVVRKRGRPRKITTVTQSNLPEKQVPYQADNQKEIELGERSLQMSRRLKGESLSDRKMSRSAVEEGNSRKRKNSDVSDANTCDEFSQKKNNCVEETEEKPVQKKKRGPKPKTKPEDLAMNLTSNKKEKEVRCGKCQDFTGTLKSFEIHNFKKHVGLAWVEGETPIDLTDEKHVTRLVKAAFKITKKGTCELCQDVKKSFMGFVSHIQICGKTEDEKDALKVQCPHCSAKCLKYSMPVHIKLTHTETPEGDDSCNRDSTDDGITPSGKRRSAIKAATKFQEVLKAIEEPELSARHYVYYEKEGGKFPKMCTQLSNCWYKLQRERKKIACRHVGCNVVNDTVLQAKYHHYTCAKLPSAVYMCEACEFYSVNESDLPPHVSAKHSRILKRKKLTEEGQEANESEVEENEEEEESNEDEAMDSTDDGGLGELTVSKKKKKKTKSGNDGAKRGRETLEDLRRKRQFCRRENLESDRGHPFFRNTLKITLEEEVKEAVVWNSWPGFHTQASDWKRVPLSSGSSFLPLLEESISVSSDPKEVKWRRFRRFEGDIVQGVPTIFAGGSVRCLSWCKISYQRSVAKSIKQYLAVATTKKMNHLRDIQNRSESYEGSLLQIWDCGVLGNDIAVDPPKLAMGIRHEGEIWDLEWFPEDTWGEGTSQTLPRLGLLVTAADDGIVRVWSICDPNHLASSEGCILIYETHPVVKLVMDDDLRDSCLRLSIGKGGILAGSYSNGIVAFWSLKTVSTPLSEKEGKSAIIRPYLTIQAHKTAITALKFCPSDSRYIITGALDRAVKIWDLESPTWPMEQFNRELCLGTVWPKHWPLVICNFDDIMITANKGPVKFIRDIFYDKHYCTLLMDNTCLCLSFSDWINAVCGSNNVGDIKLSLLPNFVNDLKRNKKIIPLSFSILQKLSPQSVDDIRQDENNQKPGEKPHQTSPIVHFTYDQITSAYGLIFSEDPNLEKLKSKGPEYHFMEIPIRAVNKVAFNPNFKSFTHIAAGYNSGFVRILPLKELQSNNHMKDFLQKHDKESH